MLKTTTSRFFVLLAVAAVALTTTAFLSSAINEKYFVQINLLRVGLVLSLLLTWGHTPGLRGLKIAYLGLLGFAIGGPLGLLLGESISPHGPDAISMGILMLIGGFWIGAILFAILGVCWGIGLHRRLGASKTRATG